MAQPGVPYVEVQVVEERKWMNKECFMQQMTERMATTEEARQMWDVALAKCEKRHDPNCGVEVKVTVSNRSETTTAVTESVIKSDRDEP